MKQSPSLLWRASLEGSAKMDLARSRPGAATSALALLAYALSPGISRLPGGDSGELLAEACVGGVAHPPGYPLLLLLLRIVHWVASKIAPQLPFVVAANAVNAVLAALAAGAIAHTVDLMTEKGSPTAAIFAGLLFALSKLTWEHAVGVEVFALNNLLCATLHVLVVRHFRRPTAANARLGAIVCGLGVTNQHTIVLFAAPYILWVLTTHAWTLFEVLSFAASFIVGAAVYGYTAWTAQTPTMGSWGDASNFRGFLRHILRQEYGTFKLSPREGDSESFTLRLAAYAKDVVKEFHWVAAILVVLALVQLGSLQLRSKFKFQHSWLQFSVFAQLSALSCYLIVFHSLANIPLNELTLARAVSDRFSMQPNTIVAVWIGLGLASLQPTYFFSPKTSKAPQWLSMSRICWLLQCGVGGWILLYQLCNRPHAAHASRDIIRELGESILKSLPEDALIFSYTDINWNSIRYLQNCEGQRRDVIHASLQLIPFPWFKPRQHTLYKSVKFPNLYKDVSTSLTSSGYARFLYELLVANVQGSVSVFLDLHAVNDGAIAADGNYLGLTLVPHGAVWQVFKPIDEQPSSDLVHFNSWQKNANERTKALLELGSLEVVKTMPRGSWEFVSATIATDAVYQSALFALTYWLNTGSDIIQAGQDKSEMLAAMQQYVSGLQFAATMLGEVENRVDETGVLTYPHYDMQKNTALAAMQLFVVSQALDGARALNQHKKADPRTKISNEAKRLQVQITRLLVEMQRRNDPDVKAFQAFLDQTRK